ncbi:ZIP family metal transporter [Limnobacter sp.]|uniref:ZIP family metal transporter n=1 Tax=Limnobacter sp. TaxID=2003368 RepID=UPI00258F3DA0|nr:ZIP family metal transporter [Limnobacter sp.]HEX5487146.1 ZIP family metal transporter [Limnobacter sp.]
MQGFSNRSTSGRPLQSSLPIVLLAASLGTLVAITSAAWLSFRSITRSLEPMVSLSTGVLLATSLLHLLPEALDHGMNHHALFAWLLGGLLFFFVLEKFSILRHSHHHEHDGHHHEHGFDRHEAGRGGLLIVVGDSIHNFGDGMLIASAFLVDLKLGFLTTLSIALHEVPQQTGDFLVLHNAGIARGKALRLMSISGVAAVTGALLGYTVLSQSVHALPIALVLASASFLYVAVADLIPQMQKKATLREGWQQLLFISLGVIVIAYLASVLHHH